MAYKIVVERRVSKRVQPDRVLQQIQRCASLSLKGPRGHGWKFSLPSRVASPIEGANEWIYRIAVTYNTTSSRESLSKKWPKIVQRFAQAGASGNLQSAPWKVVEPAGYENVAAEAKNVAAKTALHKVLAETDKKLGEISLERGDHYARIFSREPHINRVIDALKLAKDTEWNKRTHSLLNGPPGCGKTEIMLSTSRMIGEEKKAWLWFDATSMTKAGVIELIISSETVPGVLFIEEIEKCAENDLRWLLGIMDSRGEIRRTNYRVGNEAKNARMVIIATANDVELLKKVMAGALYSRFQNKIYCSPPEEAVMRQILEREVREIRGKMEWVDPAIEFAIKKWGMEDPRDVINVLSCGRDRLLSQEFQKDFEETLHPFERERLEKQKKERQNQTPT